MRCAVYRSSRKEFTYLYLADGMPFDDLPETLARLFGEPEPVMRLDLDKTSKLAHADLEVVRDSLARDGYYLQMPPEITVEEEISQNFG